MKSEHQEPSVIIGGGNFECDTNDINTATTTTTTTSTTTTTTSTTTKRPNTVNCTETETKYIESNNLDQTKETYNTRSSSQDVSSSSEIHPIIKTTNTATSTARTNMEPPSKSPTLPVQGPLNQSSQSSSLSMPPLPPSPPPPPPPVISPIPNNNTKNMHHQSLSSSSSSSSSSSAHSSKSFLASSFETKSRPPALDKLDPQKNGLAQVLNDFTSSILTVRLSGVTKINRVIEFSNDLCHPVTDLGERYLPKYREAAQNFRTWILNSKIIEHIFGPNCHVEIIKQSHIILNFVASALTNEHVNVIWTASLMKHCGKQVLELLTSLIRFMKAGPVLHLYHLVKNLNVEDHSEHTLFLASHALRYIWSHSPSLNQHHYHDNKQLQQCQEQTNSQHQQDKNQSGSKILNRPNNVAPNHSNYQDPKLRNNANASENVSNALKSYFNSSNICSSSAKMASDDHVMEALVEENSNTSIASNQSNKIKITSPNLASPSNTSDSNQNSNLKTNRSHILDRIIRFQPDNATSSQNKDQGTTQGKESDIDLNQISANELKEWLNRENLQDLAESASEASACCSEEKNMADFDDTYVDDEDVEVSQRYLQDENTCYTDEPSASSSSSDTYHASNVSVEFSPNYKHKVISFNRNTESVRNNTPTKSTKKDKKTNKLSVTGEKRMDEGVSNDVYQRGIETYSQFQEHKLKSISEIRRNLVETYDDEDIKYLSEYNIGNLNELGKTLLWDLLQDGKIEHLAVGLHPEIENVFVGLIMNFGDRFIRLKFIESCLENLSAGTSVIVSLRLLPRLMSFSAPSRNLPLSTMTETHMIVMWAERDFHMSYHFFKDFVKYSKERQAQLLNEEKLSISDEDSLKQNQEANCNQSMLDTSRSTNFEFNHMDKIITRLSFLTFIYSRSFSPPSMKLTIEQMDHLWNCLATDKQSADVLFQWLINQSITEDLHAADNELLNYILKEKLPSLEPETFSMRGLKLLEQLLWSKQDEGCCHSLENPGTQLLWNIGLRATTSEVSMAAIRILNHFYIYSGHSKHSKCDKGTHFIDQCMQQMSFTFDYFNKCDDALGEERLITVVQRALVLLRTHLEVFRSRWSFFLRVLQLNDEANLVSHRSNTYEVKSIMSLRIVVQAASRIEKTTIEVQTNDYIGELRAEIAKWWFTEIDNCLPMSPGNSSSSSTVSSVAAPGRPKNVDTRLDSSSEFSDFLLDHYQNIRLVSQNLDISIDMDDRQVNELDLKDMQVIYVLPAASRPNVDSESYDHMSTVYPIKKEIPAILLLQPKYFEQLLDAGQFLGSFHGKSNIVNNRAQLLSRRVWEIIQVLPTSPSQFEAYKTFGQPQIDGNGDPKVEISLPDAKCPQRLLYSLQIIDILRSLQQNPVWSTMFIRNGGLNYLFDIFISQDLLPAEYNDYWNEWQQECLAYLMKLIYQFGTKSLHSFQQSGESITSTSSTSTTKSNLNTTPCKNVVTSPNTNSLKRLKRSKANKTTVTVSIALEDRFPIRQFSNDLLKLLHDADLIFNKLILIMKSCAYCTSQTDYCYVAMSSRAMIVHHLMNFMASWCLSDSKFPKFQIAHYKSLINSIILNDLDPSIRRESCNGLYKLHMSANFIANKHLELSRAALSSSSSSSSSNNMDASEVVPVKCMYSQDLLKTLVEFLPIAEAMKPPRPIRNYFESENDILKELIMPGCKDYFWLTCRLIDAAAIPSNDLKVLYDSKTAIVDLNVLCTYLSEAIVRRQTFETRDFSVEDDGLRGLLLMMVMAIRKNPAFKYTQTAYKFIQPLFDCLFAPPNQSQRYLPKCKSPPTRTTAFDLLMELVDRCRKNYLLLVQLLIGQHDMIVKNTYPAEYWPHDDSRSEVGFVGLVNLGATCYLATCIQHLFMIPHLRYAILSIENVANIRHGETIKELQRMFAFMLESERKAYNPRNFCKHYIMDNLPLNIAEQKDMTEFLTDLISKLEESSSELRYITKSLFSGSLSNSVVSLDCNHISRTTEVFYTLRCQVADMRNLNDSLDELTVKDTLEGDNMYTCSTCGRKVRAEKRAGIVKLPRILCFNTMRYTFNMATMTKEKVNTHFSFPLRLDMSSYLEKNLIKQRQRLSNASSGGVPSSSSSPPAGSTELHSGVKQEAVEKDDYLPKSAPESESYATSPISETVTSDNVEDDNNHEEEEDGDECTIYDLIGVTVHTGTADGGHYYCFIRDCEDVSTPKDRWYLFNDAEVKPFDASHIGPECYGGEMTTKSYDAVNDRFMDFSFEKTNSAYMLFYKRVDYKYNSQSVALRYQEADTQRNSNQNNEPQQKQMGNEKVKPNENQTKQEQVLSPESSSSSDNIQRKAKRVKTTQNNDRSQSDADLASRDKGVVIDENSFELQLNSCQTNQQHKIEMDFSELSRETYRDFELPSHLSDWIWADNTKFCRDKNVFEHNYYNFMWQICANIPRNLALDCSNDLGGSANSADEISDDLLTLRTIHLAISFVLGTLMHSREKPSIASWTELLRKQFTTSQVACDWLMNLIDDEDTWLKQMLLKCPIEMVRQLFQRLCNDLTGGSIQHKKLRLSR